MLKNLVKKYRQRYSTDPLDLQDAAELNRKHLLVVSPLLFLFGIGDLIALFIRFHNDIRGHLVSFAYFGTFTIVSSYMFIHSCLVKEAPPEKAYLYKTIPFYMVFFMGICAGIYNFYMLKQPFNGVLTYCLTLSLSICAFSFSGIPFIIGIIIGASAMTPGIYANFGVSGLADVILFGVLMSWLSLYKSRTEKKYIGMLKRQKSIFEAKTFGNFTLMFDNKVVKFSRSKSNELIGYLIYKNGSSVNSKELIAALWGENAESPSYGSNLRNLIADIKHTFADLEINSFFITEYNSFRINPDFIKCDFYDFLVGDKKAMKKFAGEFMSQ
ncbi:MAG: hypothetical protein J5647_00640 [Spirochaetaceae bacterium]|nr:hypothetical protein [Spirochaetaceae bacterium]